MGNKQTRVRVQEIQTDIEVTINSNKKKSRQNCSQFVTTIQWNSCHYAPARQTKHTIYLCGSKVSIALRVQSQQAINIVYDSWSRKETTELHITLKQVRNLDFP